MADGLLIKGVAMVSAVDVLLTNRERFEPHVPPELRKYLDDLPYAGDWYPTADVIGLCEAIRLGAFAEMGRQEAFEMMGGITVQRDLFGDAAVMVTEEARARGGAYEGVLKPELDFVTSTRRAVALWQLYYDQGEQICERAGARTLRVRLVGTKSPAEEICWMNNGYYKAVVASLGVGAKVEHSSCSAHGDAECVWTVTYHDALDPASLDAFGPCT